MNFPTAFEALDGSSIPLTRSNAFNHLAPAYLKVETRLGFCFKTDVHFTPVRSTGQCNTACSLSAGVSKPKVFRGR
jgi:hypothetical protein